MSNYEELKRLAEGCPVNSSVIHGSPEYKAFVKYVDAVKPAAVLALIASLDSFKQGAKADADAADEARSEVRRLKAECEGLRESNDKLTRRNGMLEQNVLVMTETHVLYTWLRKKCDQPSNDVVAVLMNIGHDWATVHDLDADLRAMIDREEP